MPLNTPNNQKAFLGGLGGFGFALLLLVILLGLVAFVMAPR